MEVTWNLDKETIWFRLRVWYLIFCLLVIYLTIINLIWLNLSFIGLALFILFWLNFFLCVYGFNFILNLNIWTMSSDKLLKKSSKKINGHARIENGLRNSSDGCIMCQNGNNEFIVSHRRSAAMASSSRTEA